MPDNRPRRHTLRAQGRAQFEGRATSGSSKIIAGGQTASRIPSQSSSISNDEKYSRLLDYLSSSGAGSDRTILDHATTDAVVSSSSAASLLESWFNAGGVSSDVDADGDGLSDGYWPGGGNDTLADVDSNAGLYPANYSGGYFGTERNARGQSRRVQKEIDDGVPGGPGAYLRSLRKIAEQARQADAQAGAANGRAVSRCGSPVEVTEETGGARTETFPTGARVFKDGLGHVREIVSAGGVTVVFKYDEQGHLSTFVRTDMKGGIHSLAEADKHGVILRDASGRVKAQGESMQVDACGCVSIARQDGQFWSLDLVRNVNIERRLLPDEHGNWFSMTALFSSDGFRMATRFRQVKPEDLSTASVADFGTADGAHPSRSEDYQERYASQYSSQYARRVPGALAGQKMVDGTMATLAPGRIDFLSQEDSGNYRFYGRDGSIIEFTSDDELRQLKPSRVMPAASRPVASGHRGKRQAGTAWEALREYVFNYLAAL